jgi:hypothetical protein
MRIRSRLTYANVMVTIPAFIVLGGGTAAAVNYVVSSNSQIGPDTVSGHHLPTGKHANLIAGSVDGTDVADHSLRGTDVLESSLGAVPDAKYAAGANTLAGSPAAGFQRRVTGSCKQARGRSPRSGPTAGSPAHSEPSIRST